MKIVSAWFQVAFVLAKIERLHSCKSQEKAFDEGDDEDELIQRALCCRPMPIPSFVRKVT